MTMTLYLKKLPPHVQISQFVIQRTEKPKRIGKDMRVNTDFHFWVNIIKGTGKVDCSVFYHRFENSRSLEPPTETAMAQRAQIPGQAFFLNHPKKLQSHLAQTHTHWQSGSHKITWGPPPTHQTHPYTHTHNNNNNHISFIKQLQLLYIHLHTQLTFFEHVN